MKVLYVALSSARLPQVARDAAHVVEQGGEAVILTTKSEQLPEVPSVVRVLELATAESAHWFVRSERVAVFRLPALVLRAVRKLLTVLAKVLPGPGGRARDAVERLMVRQAKAAKRFHKERFGPFYRNFRPFVLWRVARSHALDGLDIDSFDAVVVGDSMSTAIGWQLADAHPALDVGFDLIRDRA